MRLEYDREQNALRVSLTANRAEMAGKEYRHGVVDVVEGGRLFGVEIRPAEDVSALKHQLRPWFHDGLAGQYISIDSDGSAYIELSEQSTREAVRSCEVVITLELDSEDKVRSFSFPRRGSGYEISYPSGNR